MYNILFKTVLTGESSQFFYNDFFEDDSTSNPVELHRSDGLMRKEFERDRHDNFDRPVEEEKPLFGGNNLFVGKFVESLQQKVSSNWHISNSMHIEINQAL